MESGYIDQRVKDSSFERLPQLSNPPLLVSAVTTQRPCWINCNRLVLTTSLTGCTLNTIWIDKWLDEAPADVPHRRNIIYLFVRLAERSGELPQSLFIRGVDIGSSRDPYRTGGFSDVFFGTYLGKNVAVKRLRVSDEERTTVHAVSIFFRLHSS